MNNHMKTPGSEAPGDGKQGCCVQGMRKDVTGRSGGEGGIRTLEGIAPLAV